MKHEWDEVVYSRDVRECVSTIGLNSLSVEVSVPIDTLVHHRISNLEQECSIAVSAGLLSVLLAKVKADYNTYLELAETFNGTVVTKTGLHCSSIQHVVGQRVALQKRQYRTFSSRVEAFINHQRSIMHQALFETHAAVDLLHAKYMFAEAISKSHIVVFVQSVLDSNGPSWNSAASTAALESIRAATSEALSIKVIEDANQSLFIGLIEWANTTEDDLKKSLRQIKYIEATGYSDTLMRTSFLQSKQTLTSAAFDLNGRLTMSLMLWLSASLTENITISTPTEETLLVQATAVVSRRRAATCEAFIETFEQQVETIFLAYGVGPWNLVVTAESPCDANNTISFSVTIAPNIAIGEGKSLSSQTLFVFLIFMWGVTLFI